MATTTIGKNIDEEIGKFYLESLESLRIRGMGGKCDEFSHFFYDIRDKTEANTQYRALDKLNRI